MIAAGPTVNLRARVTSPVARFHIRKLYRYARRSGATRFDARVVVNRAVLAVECEGDEGFAGGIRAEAVARRVAVGLSMRRAG